MTPDLRQHYILITGAGRGLGEHLAHHLATCGAIIGVADLDGENANKVVTALTSKGHEAYAYAGDVADQATFFKIADDFASHGGRIDAIINNAMLLHYCPVEQVEDGRLSTMLDVGIKAPFWAAQALLKHLDPARGAA